MKKTEIINLSIVLCAIPLSVASTFYLLGSNRITLFDRVGLTFSPFSSGLIWSNGLDGAVLAIPFVLLTLGTVLATIKMKRITSHTLATLTTVLWVFIVLVVTFMKYGP